MTDVFALCDRLTDEFAELWPTDATYAGIPGHDHRWPDHSPAGAERTAAALAGMRRRVGELGEPPDGWHELAARVAATMLDLALEEYEAREHLRTLNSVDSPIQDGLEVFDQMDTESREGWEAVAARLEGLPQFLAGYREALDAGRAAGLAVAQRQVLAGIDQCRTAAGAGSSLRNLIGELGEWGGGDDTLAKRVGIGVEAACEAFGELADYLEETYLRDAVGVDGVGEDRYVRSARQFLGTTIEPAETYEWGWSEVERLRADMERVAGEIQPGAIVAEAIALLKTDPDRAAASRDEFVRIMEERQRFALAALDGTHFDVPPQIRDVEVRIAPYRGSLGAYYVQPSEDFSRPGRVWYSLAPGQEVVPLYDEVSTAYHEGFPGHHLQCGVQVALADKLSRLHRMFVWYPGYGEGWALYTERLMHELGYLEKPDYVMGLLSTQMLRACRVAIDIGVHLDLPIPDGQPFHPGERWTYDVAVEMLRDYATLGDDYARSEVTRYMGWPGQAIAYKVGERVILELRDELRSRQGDAFDLKGFHRRVLETGPVGLDLLRERVLY